MEWITEMASPSDQSVLLPSLLVLVPAWLNEMVISSESSSVPHGSISFEHEKNRGPAKSSIINAYGGAIRNKRVVFIR